MHTCTSKRSITSLFCAALILLLCTTPLMAQKMTKISGKMTVAATMQERAEIGDTEGHVVGFFIYEGTNVNTGTSEFMDGAHVMNTIYVDYIMGSGPHQTYVKMSTNGGAAFAKCEGETKTVLSDDDTPVVTFEGTFTYVGGTGAYENIHGGGTYKGKFIAEKIYVAMWEGEYSIKK